MKDNNKKSAVQRAMNLLLYRDRSEQELRGRLLRDGYSPEETEAAMEYVMSFGYVNDRRFAETYTHTYAGKKSRSVIAASLRSLGVDEGYIEAAMEELPGSETEDILNLLKKRAGCPHVLDEKEKRRHFAYMARRGYASADILKAFRIFRDLAEEEQKKV